jgi:hypothetical protein
MAELVGRAFCTWNAESMDAVLAPALMADKAIAEARKIIEQVAEKWIRISGAGGKA